MARKEAPRSKVEVDVVVSGASLTVELNCTAAGAWSKVVEDVTGSAGADGSAVVVEASGAVAVFEGAESVNLACNLACDFVCV